MPVTALAIALVGGTIYAARQYPPMATPAVLLIVYMAASRLDARRSRLVLIVAAVMSWLAATLAAGPTELAAVLYVAGAWLLGHYVRTRRLLVAELERRRRPGAPTRSSRRGPSPRSDFASPASCTTSSPTR